MNRIMVIGASGKTGRHVIPGLLSRGADVRAASREPNRLNATGADRVRFDWEDESTWASSLDGINGVYLVKPDSESVVEIVAKFLDSMKAAGVRRLVLLSECAAQTRSPEITERHVEQLVETSGFEWTILRPSWFMDDIVDEEFFAPMIRDKRMIVMTTGGAGTAWIDCRDIGDVAAEILANGGWARQALDLSGPEALNLEQLAKCISNAAGEHVTAVEESIFDAKARMRMSGFDESFTAYITRIAESVIAGDTGTVTSDVEQVIGRPPRTIRAFLTEHAALLRPKSE
ncbi:MAG: NAD(P)H-binding protein [Burkholderiaceae bacterium]|nr:NAD(P)H-binding protein [Burkholderiaceae bacterium]